MRTCLDALFVVLHHIIVEHKFYALCNFITITIEANAEFNRIAFLQLREVRIQQIRCVEEEVVRWIFDEAIPLDQS